MEKLPAQPDNANVLVGFNTADDAGIIKISNELALVQTVDFFTPIVDDPFIYGQIAAANSFSDIYAMGGKPISALNIVGFPKDLFPLETLSDILYGGQLKAEEAGAVILGGHTIGDDELKYGLAVTGLVHPEKVLTNAQAQPGDLLVLTKPIGTGAITTMLKNGSIDNTILNAATESMTRLNKSAMEACLQISVNAVTDVSGFGLLGHALEMAKASNVSLSLTFANVPILTGAIEAIKAGGVPGGTKANFLYTAADVDYAASLSKEEQWLLNDPQTSGGLLVSVSENKAAALIQRLIDDGANAAIIGTVEAKERDKIRVRP